MRILLLIGVILLIDFYVFQAVRFSFRTSSETLRGWVYGIYWSITAFSVIILLATLFSDWQTWDKAFRTYSFSFIFIATFSKLFTIVFLLADDLIRLMRWLFAKVSSSFPSNEQLEMGKENQITRHDFLVKTGLVVAAIPFLSLLWGMIRGAYDYHVRKIKVALPNLPKAFEGYKIVQISDIHSGSFMSGEPLQEAVRIINEQKADLVLFTGDLVNNRHDEAVPYKHILEQIKSVNGVFSTLGNHDYGDYVQWDSQESKQKNLDDLVQFHRSIGWNILMDEHRHIDKDGERLTLIGVQNWSSHLRFPKYGSMEKATTNLEYSSVNILLSHDPSHWRSEILKQYPKIDLTLSGHTHGFQFGVEIKSLKWSPVQYVYKEWAGLYKEGQQYLYVNRGLGFLGYPGRVGILPEITVLELTSKV